MMCNLCNKPIGFHQMRHSDGNGDFHVVCEFNLVRRELGMPPFELMKLARYSSVTLKSVSSKRVHLSLRNEVTQVNQK